MDGISILITIDDNSITFFEETYTSVLNQSYTKWELIIGIYNSNSDIDNIINKINNKYNHNNSFDVKIIHYNTIHIPDTLNKMLNDTKYEFIALINSNDLWHKNKLELQSKFLNKYDVIGTNYKNFGYSKITPIIPLGYINNFNFLNYNPIIYSSCIIKKNYAYWINSFSGLHHYELILRLKFNNKSFYNLEDILCFYRICDSNIYYTNDSIYTLKKYWFSKFFYYYNLI